MNTGIRVVLICMLVSGLSRCTVRWATAGPNAAEVPDFKVRVKVVSQADAPPAESDRFKLTLGVNPEPVLFAGSRWSPWIASTREGIETAVGRYPNSYNRFWQVKVACKIAPHGRPFAPLGLEVETAINQGETSSSPAELYGPALGLILWRDADETVHIDTLAGHGRRVYGSALQEALLPGDERPRKIIFGDRYIGGDNDLICWREGIERLCGLGFNALHPVPPELVETVRGSGVAKLWGAVYNPPGYAFNFAPDRMEVFSGFVSNQIASSLAAGWQKEDIAYWVTSDEPGWYYPARYDAFNEDTNALSAFHAYLRDRGLTQEDLGKSTWDEVRLIGRREYTDLPSRRLFYWSNRFVPWASSRFFSEVAHAYEEGIRPAIPIMVNFNNFLGRLYQPGPIANNSAKTSANAGMGQHDWLEFGRLRGTTCIATEDWFGDDRAPQWSFYASRLRAAAELGDVGFGALVIPRVSGQRPNGMAQKLLALVGHGAKTINFFVFGPEYNFPGNCYSENSSVFKPLSEGMRLTARAEDLLYPGRPKTPRVAILTPQSAQLWDLEDVDIPTSLMDVTNGNMYRHHMAYMSEVYSLFLAMQHAAVPVQFIDEARLTEEGLGAFKVIYLTAPDIPEECALALKRWVGGGGTLVMTGGAGEYDRYHQRMRLLTWASGVEAGSMPRTLISNLDAVAATATIPYGDTALAVYGDRQAFNNVERATVTRRFEGGQPAVTERTMGRGRIIRYACYPGISYRKSATTTTGGLLSGFSDEWRRLILDPVFNGPIRLPVTVSAPMIEAPALYSAEGVAVTLLNWSGAPIDQVTIRTRTDRSVRSAESAQSGELEFQQIRPGWFTRQRDVSVTLDVGDVDVMMLRY